MRYLSGEEVLVLHSEIIEKTGGFHGVREVGLFLSILEKPKARFGGKELYKGVFVKAAVYCEAFARYHVFVDGNKRTAIAATARFLHLNGFELVASNRDVEDFALRLVEKKLEIKTISAWLKKHSVKK